MKIKVLQNIWLNKSFTVYLMFKIKENTMLIIQISMTASTIKSHCFAEMVFLN